jgi:hypothetical protein
MKNTAQRSIRVDGLQLPLSLAFHMSEVAAPKTCAAIQKTAGMRPFPDFQLVEI